ncbi:tagaturonate reductase [Flavonifractor sp. DFI.6.63]|uniref:tagaturonate reductase n=1 Tax=Oscillospiraceae TaxID=216572 RepID=UPI002108C383|nr:tagaturonate reductase [Flavonifractor sp. DFI.6.63]MCQ5030472.1 tagaturonate reductase [Flavonifractor sp. DFI.6.63]
MRQLTYAVLKEGDGGILRQAPERVLQFGEGNFLRGFADDFIDRMNERAGFYGRVVVVPPASAGKAGRINAQQGLYQLCLRGKQNGAVVEERRMIRCISRALDVFADWDELLRTACQPELRFVISNTTEAGIVYDPACRWDDRPPASFPAKLTRLLWERWRSGASGWVLLPCELIADNGVVLREYVLRHAADWGLEEAFRRWLETENRFCSTLVDRIVTGYPKQWAAQLDEENGYADALLDTAEPFGLWVIEAPEALAEEFPAPQAGLPVKFVSDHHPYKEQKVRILNGGHTAMVPAAFLAGHDIVRTCMEDPAVRAFLQGALYEEIIPTLSLPREDCEAFARAVEERFANPYIDHRLLDIALNSVSKWRARVLPSVRAYPAGGGRLPVRLTFSFAALAAFYTQGMRDGVPYPVRDDAAVMEFFRQTKGLAPEALIRALAARTDFWGEDLNALPGFVPAAGRALERIRACGMAAALARCQEEAGL